MSTALTLYELSEEQTALDALLALDAGECTPESDALTEELATALAKKADSFGAYITTLGAATSIIDDEVTRLSARRKAVQGKIDRLKRYGLMALQAMDRPRIEGALYTLSVQANPPRVEVSVGVDALAPEYVRCVPESREVNKAAISAALKAGAQIDGCALVVSHSLRVR